MDRVVALSFDRIEAGSEIITRTLWVELLPASPNMILTEGNTIIDACLRGKKLDRLLVPGETYSLPGHGDRMDFMKFSREELKNILDFSRKEDIPLDSWLFVFPFRRKVKQGRIVGINHKAYNVPVSAEKLQIHNTVVYLVYLPHLAGIQLQFFGNYI
jgi:hypothetical protein